MASVDGLVIGRHTLETVLGFERWPYGEKPVTVLTTRPPGAGDMSMWTAESPSSGSSGPD
jgi:hypothetical protein